MTALFGRCEYCGSDIVVKADKSSRGRYKRYCGQTCKNKANKISSALNLQAARTAIVTDVERCVDCGSTDIAVRVGNKGFCLPCVNK